MSIFSVFTIVFSFIYTRESLIKPEKFLNRGGKFHKDDSRKFANFESLLSKLALIELLIKLIIIIIIISTRTKKNYESFVSHLPHLSNTHVTGTLKNNLRASEF